ncbi:hypothetical protein SDC9_107994 [bioreactor metagenome]|uniref:Uncharacterized protein n=1 Tax=bioreactor metagenome TaxID=1076179 RepID=A0A645B6S8_9ZZZZ
MQAVGIGALPVVRGDEVPQRILVVMRRELGLSGRTGGKEHQHEVASAGRVVPAQKPSAEQRILLVETVPAFALAAHEDFVPKPRVVRAGKVGNLRRVSVRRADERAHARFFEPVGVVVFLQQVCGRNADCADLMQAEKRKPELVMAFEHQQNPVALFDAEGLKVVGALVRRALHIRKRKPALRAIFCNMQHGELVRLGFRKAVHDVERKVKAFFADKADCPHTALLVRFGPKITVKNPLFLLLFRRFGIPAGVDQLRLAPLARVGGGVEHDGVKLAVLAADGNHAVGNRAVVVSTVAGAQNFDMRTDLHLKRSADYEVAFLAFVAGELNAFLLRFRHIGALDVQRLGNTVLKRGGKVVVNHAVRLLDARAFARAGDGVPLQRRARALDDVGDVDAKRHRAAVDERKA